LEKAVGGAPQLEGAAGLQALALQPDFRAADVAFDERSPLDESADAGARLGDVVERDFRPPG